MTPSTSQQNLLALVGRILLAVLFVPAGFGKIGGFAGTVGYISSVGLPLPQLGAVIAIVVELGLGLALLLGWRARLSALVMAVFTVAAAVFFHNYWAAPEAAVMMQKINFFKNIGLAGGLLFIVSFGAGGYSLDARMNRE